MLSPDSYEEDNFPSDGQLLLPSEVQSHVIYPDGDVDWFKVSVLEGQQYIVETLDLVGSRADTVLEVYDDTGALIAENDNVDYYLGFESLVSWTAMYTGTYYVKARTWGGSSGHFDDQGGGEAFCSYEIGFPCSDLDEDGYGDPGSVLCTYPELDCDDSSSSVNPGAKEICGNGIDDDCNGEIDVDCGIWAAANAHASLYGVGEVAGSGVVNLLSLLVVPLCVVVFLRFVSKKK